MTRTLLIALLAISVSSTSFAGETCRSLIVDTYQVFGVSLNPMGFSSTTFEELNISIEEFNAMSAENQQTIYTLIKPMSVSVGDAIDTINSIINRYTGTLYEFDLLDELQALREKRDMLRSCEI